MTDGIRLTREQQRRRRHRSIVLGLALAATAVLFYLVAFIKGPGVLDKSF